MNAKRWLTASCLLGMLVVGSGESLGQRFGGGNQGGGLFRNQGGYGNQGGGLFNNNGGFRPSGNWFDIVTTPGHFNERIGWVPGESTVRPNWGNIVPDLVGAVNRPSRPNVNNNYVPNYVQPAYPQPNYVQPNYVQPNYVQPQAVASPPARPKKNVVVKKVTPKSNGDFNAFKEGFALNATAETDFQQVSVAMDTLMVLEAVTRDEINQIANAVDRAAADADYDKVKDAANLEQKAKALDEFNQKHRDKLSADGKANLDTQMKLVKYQQALKEGTLTSAGKDQALRDIEDSLNGFKDPQLRGFAQGKLTKMKDLNDLGKLAEAAEGQPNPLGILMTGAGNAGFPPSFVGEMVGLPVMDVDPLADKPTATAITGGSVIVNPAENGGPVNYSLGQYQFSMEPGQSQKVDSGYTIAFDSGKGGQKTYKLAEGSYKFVVTDAGWDLRKATFSVTIDNSDYKADFNFVANNEQSTVRAGQSVTLNSPYPLDVVFDRGNGDEQGHKLLLSGTYKVGVDPSETRLDLFDAVTIAQGPKTPDALAQAGGAKPQTEAQKRAALIQQKLRAKTGESDADKLLEQLRNRNRPAAGGEAIPPGAPAPLPGLGVPFAPPAKP